MAARHTRRQLQFSSVEIGILGAFFVVTVISVFFLGLFVGKRNASWHAPAQDRVARIPVDDFTRYRRPAPLEKPVRETKPSAEAATVASTASALPAAAPGPGSPSVVETPANASKPEAAQSVARNAAAGEAAKAGEVAAAKEAAAKKSAAAKAEKEKEQAEPVTGKGYTVQILATRKQGEADVLVQKLKSRGYAAYVKRVSNGGESWYRVRVGSYGAFSEAKGMADKCRRDLSLGQAFVSTE